MVVDLAAESDFVGGGVDLGGVAVRVAEAVQAVFGLADDLKRAGVVVAGEHAEGGGSHGGELHCLRYCAGWVRERAQSVCEGVAGHLQEGCQAFSRRV